jgi:hypothetical protein
VSSGTARLVGKPFRDVETVVFENLEDLGVVGAERSAIESLETPDAATLAAADLGFVATPKSSFKFAEVANWEGRDLDGERRLAFKQRRLLRGRPYETVLVTNPMPADVAGRIGSQLEARPSDGRQFVHFMRLKTGAISALRWPIGKFKNIMAGTGAMIKPLFGAIDIPTATGTGVLSAGAMVLAYNYGYDEGQTATEESGSLNLEAMLKPNTTPPVDTLER